MKLGGKVQFHNASRPNDQGPFINRGAHGCFLSHLEVLKDAKGQSVLILEDDCDFSPFAQYYEPPECDIFYGGFLEVTCQASPKDGGIIGSHCMGFSARAAEAAAHYLESLLDPATPPDAVAQTEAGFDPAIRPPIDGAYVWFRRAHPELVTHLAPFLTMQRPSRSDVTPRLLDRLPLVRTGMEVLRSMRQRSFAT